MTALPLIITKAGLARFAAAQLGQAIDLTVAAVGVTDQVFVPAPTLTALPGEHRRLATVSGALVGDDVVHLTIRDDPGDGYGVRGFGLFLADGTLLAVYGQADRIVEKSAQVALFLALDVAFPLSGVDHLTFGATNFLAPPATTTIKGVVELATKTEGLARTDTARVPPVAVVAAMMAAWLPIGVVTLWSGTTATVPAGWAICDGREVDRSDGAGRIATPDLRDRVPVGASAIYAAGATFGTKTAEVDTGAAGGHSHTGTAPAHTHGYKATGSSAGASDGITITPAVATNTAGGGTGRSLTDVTVAIDDVTEASAPLALEIQAADPHRHRVTIDLAPPSIALHFIMRV